MPLNHKKAPVLERSNEYVRYRLLAFSARQFAASSAPSCRQCYMNNSVFIPRPILLALIYSPLHEEEGSPTDAGWFMSTFD